MCRDGHASTKDIIVSKSMRNSRQHRDWHSESAIRVRKGQIIGLDVKILLDCSCLRERTRQAMHDHNDWGGGGHPLSVVLHTPLPPV
jgi:hypothetical protein